MILLSGCKAQTRASLQQDWQQARLQLLQGYVTPPLNSAIQGFKDSGRFPDLNWKFRSLLADIQVRNNQLASALELVAPEPPNGLPLDVTWRYALSRAYVHCHAHSFKGFSAEFHRIENIADSDPARRAEAAMVRGRCELERDNFGTASELFTDSIKGPGGDEFVRLYAVLGLGVAAMRSHDYENSARWFGMALEQEISLQAVPLEQATRGNLGYVYFELGDFETALQNSKAAAEAAEKLGFVQLQEKWVLDTGRAYDATGQSGLAEQYYRKALSLARSDHSDDIAGMALHNLTFRELQKGDLKQAVELHSEAAKLNLQHDSAMYFKFDEASIAALSHDSTKAERLLLNLLPLVSNDTRRTWMVEAELARVYAGQGSTGSADEWFQKSIQTMAEGAGGRKVVEFKVAMLDNWPIFDDYIAFLFQQNRPERALQVAQLARARTLSEQLGFKPTREDAAKWVNKIRSMLRMRRSVLLAYYEAEHETYAWVVTGNKLEMKALGTNQNDLETLADSYNQEIVQHTTIDSSLAEQKLYQLLIKPVSDLIPHDAHVILVADSALYRINFETLICNQPTPHYWIDDVELENASSIDLLLADKHVSRRGTGALIIGAPKQVSPQYPLLPHAQEEVESVEHQFPPGAVKAFEGAAATPDAYLKSQPSRFKYIEFASHSTASSSDPMASSIVLSKGSNGFQLFASDIVQVRPRLNADLVSISGCYSIGKVRTSAEGLLGLQWAFMRAGAHQVVAGLWDVDDKSSPQLMGGLYSGITHGQSAAAALRAAKRKMIHASQTPPPPYYWASLQLYTGL